MQKNDILIFREVKGKEELLSLLKLRYKVYRNSPLKVFCPENKYEIDLDNWDLYARHIGLFLRDNNQAIPIGYLRLIGPKLTSFAPQILELAIEQNPSFATAIFEKKKKGTYPFENYFPEISRNAQKNQSKIIEVSRLVLDKKYRSKRLASKFIIKSIAALCIYQFKYDFAIIVCSEKHALLYQSFGFEKVNNQSIDVLGIPAGCLKVSANSFSPETLFEFQTVSDEYQKTGKIILKNNSDKAFIDDNPI